MVARRGSAARLVRNLTFVAACSVLAAGGGSARADALPTTVEPVPADAPAPVPAPAPAPAPEPKETPGAEAVDTTAAPFAEPAFGPRYTIEDVAVRGNKKTKTPLIAAEL